VTAPNELSEPAAPTRDGGLAGSPPEVRLRLDLGYDGTDFAGWARQPQLRTVAQVVEDALATVLRLDDPPRLTVAGRTDAGVHATGQVAHVDIAAKPGAAAPEPIDVDIVTRRLAGVLPDDVVLHRLQVAPEGFHARFSALGRRYVYRVADRGSNPLRRHDTVGWPRPLDPSAMQQAAAGLQGEHDFAAYCRPRVGATTIRTLHEMRVTRDSEDVLLVAAHADAFCHSQIRSMVGALLAVGEGRRPISWPAEVLGSGVRNSLVNVAPAHGLTLIAVDYPPDRELAARVSQTRQRRQRQP
jgi:tRNA pseudouridine38-40 synthase